MAGFCMIDTPKMINLMNRWACVFLLLLFAKGAEAALSVSLPTTSTGSYTLSWSGGDQYAYVTENGVSIVPSQTYPPSASGSITFTGKASGTYSYFLQNFCFNGRSVSECDSVTVSVTVQGTPVNPTMNGISIGNHAISFSWTGSSVVTYYKVTRNPGGLIASSVSATSFNDTDSALSPGTFYSYTVQACNASGCSSGATSSSIQYPAVPAVPSTFSATPSGANVVLSWSNVSASSYLLSRSGASWTLSGGTYTNTDTGAPAGAATTYTLQSCNAASVCSSTSTAITLPAVPAAPASLSATYDSTQIQGVLSWAAVSPAPDHYMLSGNSAGTSGNPSVSGSTTTFYDATIGAGQTYTYYVYACNVNNVCSGGTRQTMATPTIALGVIAGNNTVTFKVLDPNSWSITENGVTVQNGSASGSVQTLGPLSHSPGVYQYYLVSHLPGGDVSNGPVSVTILGAPSVPPSFGASLGNRSINVSWAVPTGNIPGTTTYQITRSPAFSSNPAAFSSTSYSDTNVTSGTGYTYYLTACNGGNCSGQTTTQISYPSDPSSQTLSTSIAGANVNLSWSNVSGISYTLTRNGTNLSFNCAGASCSATDANAPVSPTTNTYSLRACNLAQVCLATAATATVTLPTVPAIPSVDAAMNGMYVYATWSATGADHYRVNGGADTQTTSKTETPTLAGTSYSYSVVACNVNNVCSSAGTKNYTTQAGALYTIVASGTNTVAVQLTTGAYQWVLQQSSDNNNFSNVSGVSGSNATNGNILNYTVALPKGTYYFRIAYVASPGGSSVPLPAQTVVLAGASSPAAPTISAALNANGNGVNVTWTGTSGYQLYRDGTLVSSGSANTGYNDTNVQAGQTHTYAVSACNVYTNGGVTSLGECTNYAANPQSSTGYSITPIGAWGTATALISNYDTGVATLSFSGVTNATKYYVTSVCGSQGGSQAGPSATQAAVQGVNTLTLSPINLSCTYYLTLKACNEAGIFSNCVTYSTNSLTVALNGSPTAPTSVTGSTQSSNGSVTINWAGASGNTGHFQLYRNGVLFNASIPATQSSITLTETQNNLYSYTVAACNLLGCSLPSSSTLTTAVAIVGAVTTVGGSLNKASGVAQVTWGAATGATYYAVDVWNTAVTPNVKVASSTLNSPFPSPLAATLNLTTAGTFVFKVTPHAVVGSFDNAGATLTSASSFTLAKPTGAPSYVTPTPTNSSNGSYSFSWNAVTNAQDYIVNETVNNVSTDLTPRVSSPRSFSASGKANNTYKYKIKACNVIGCAASYGSTITIDVAQPPVISNVSASLLQNTGVTTLTWTSSTPTSVSIQKKRNGLTTNADGSAIAAVSTSATTYTFPAVVDPGTYTYEIKACVTVGVTTNCSTPVASPAVSPIQPDAPLLSSPLLSGSGFYAVTWSKSLWATHYKLFENSVLIQDTTEWSKAFTPPSGKTNGTYLYQVQACWIVCSPLSNLSTTTVTLASNTTNPANSSGGTTFNFATEAPANFTYPLTPSGVPDLGASQFVAATQGNINVSNGSAQYSVKLDLPPAIRDLKPSLAFNYSSQAGNGVMGVGWNLSGLSSITRCRSSFVVEGAEAQKSNPRYSRGDRLCLDGQKMILSAMSTPADDLLYWGGNSEYKTEIDNFSRILAYGSDVGTQTNTSSHAYFKVFTKDGRTLTYGGQTNNQNSRIRRAGDPNSVVGTWLLDKVEDAYGNSYTITYKGDSTDNDYRPDRINYTPNTIVKFEYDSRPTGVQIPSGYDMGGFYRHPNRLKRVTTYVDAASLTDETTGIPVKQYQVAYKQSATTQRDLVDTLSECGWSGSSWQCAKPLTFSWQAGEQGFDTTNPITPVWCDASGGGAITNIERMSDIDGDGYNDFLFGGDIGYGTAQGCFVRKTNIGGTQPILTRQGYAILWESIVSDTPTQSHTDLYITYGALKTGNVTNIKIASSPVGQPSSAVVEDLDNDSLGDIRFGNRIYYQQNQMTPRFQAIGSMLYSEDIGFPFYLDLNGDGIKDGIFMSMKVAPGYMEPPSTTNYPLGNNVVFKDLYEQNIYLTKNTGATQNSSIFEVSPGTPYDVGGESLTKLPGGFYKIIADFNGDGELDFAYFRQKLNSSVSGDYEWMYRLNQENAIGTEIRTGINVRVPTDFYPANINSYPIDWDKDGRDDLLVIDPNPANTSLCSMRILLSRDKIDGNGNQVLDFVEAKDANGFKVVFNALEYAPCLQINTTAAVNVMRGDINNDGIIDLWVPGVGSTAEGTIYLGKTQKPDLMTVVTDGFGAQAKVEYSTLVDTPNNGKPLYTPDAVAPSFPQRAANRGMQVVKKLSFSNGQGGFNDRFFNYSGARADVQGRGFLGFANIQITDVANSTNTSMDYRLDFPFIGRLDMVTSKTTSGNLISSVKNAYAVHSTNARFPYVDYSIQKSYQLTTTDANSPLSATKVKNTYDACGNLTEQQSDTGTGVTASTITGVLGHKRVFNEINNYGTTTDCSDDFTYRTTQETSKTSLSDDFRSSVTEFTPTNSTAGALKEVYTVTANKGTLLESTTTITRNGNGLVTGSSQVAKDIDAGTAATRIVTTSNFARGMYPQTVTSVLSSGNLITNTRYDYRFGEANYVKTPNGLSTTREFDPLGRVINEYSPDMSRRELVAFYCANISTVTCPANAVYGVATRVTNTFLPNTLGSPLSITYYDSLQRPVRSTTYTLNGNAINVDRVYRADGKVDKVSEPYNTNTGAGSPAAWSTYTNYDEMGVPHTETGADGGSRVTSFDRSGNSYHITQSVIVLKSSGNQVQTTQRYVNALGQVEKVLDALSTPVDYTYNSFGGLATTQVANNLSTKVTINYDAAGNKSNMLDPDAGAIDFEYNGFGELRRQTWQKGTAYAKSMTMAYDQLGRQVTRVDQPVSGNATSYTWAWDTQQPGLLSSETGNGQTITYLYDELGRPNAMTTSITGLADKIFSYSYDAYSRPSAVTYPNGLSIQRKYHANGMAVQTQDVTDQANPKVLWALGNDVDARGSFTNQLWGNGVVTQTAFDALSGQLKTIKSGHLTATNTIGSLKGDIQNLTYSFDSIGNLQSRNTQRTNGAGVALENTTEQFAYDALNRLKASTTSGLFARINSYDYDSLGNLINRTSYLGSSSTNDDVGVLTYAGTNNAGVHAVTSAGGTNYQYDKYGNMTQRGTETITYDVFNKPITISNSTTTTTLLYDANHNRFKENDGINTTYTIAGGLYEEVVTGTTSTQKSYIDGVIINTKVFNSSVLASNDTQYLHTDHLGSVEAMSDKFGAFINRMSFSDWGNRQKSDWSTGSPTLNFATQNGYTGHHEMDKHNLVHMGGRVYDPTIGRFLSADLLIQEPNNTQSYNRYSYVMNNPTGYIDPSGYCRQGYGVSDNWGMDHAMDNYDRMHQEQIIDAMNENIAYEAHKQEQAYEKAQGHSEIQIADNNADWSGWRNQLHAMQNYKNSGQSKEGEEVEEVVVTGVRSASPTPAPHTPKYDRQSYTNLSLPYYSQPDSPSNLWAANQIRRTNTDPDLKVKVNASNMVVATNMKLLKSRGDAPALALTSWFTFGGVHLTYKNGKITMDNDSYDFKTSDHPGETFRNFETRIGGAVAGGGVDFEFVFEGSPHVVDVGPVPLTAVAVFFSPGLIMF